MIKNILFDFDGTLVDTNNVVLESFQHTFEHFLGERVPEERITKFFGEILPITIAREFPQFDTDEVIEFYREYQVNYASKLIKEFPGIREMLEELYNRGYKLVIVTSRTKVSTLSYLDIFDYGKYFTDIVSCDDTEAHKPDPEPINLALRKINGKKEESIMVGDGPFDIKCANNADVKAILVGWKITGDANTIIGDYKVDFEVEKPSDIVKLLEEINC